MVKAVACFVEGTTIRTKSGDIPVEKLRVDDKLLTAQGEETPLVWKGWRTLDLRGFSGNKNEVLPICIRAGAVSQGVPYKDLYVSPNHAVFLSERLVSARRLVNGCTVRQSATNNVTYYHIQCNKHMILVANNLPAESYLENHDRAFFSNVEGQTSLYPALPQSPQAGSLAAPWANLEELASIRQVLYDRAAEMGYDSIYHPDLSKIFRMRVA